MTRVILICEAVPEATTIYDFQLEGETLEMVKKCHCVFGNTEAVPVNDLYEWLAKQQDHIIFSTEKEIGKEWIPQIDSPCIIIHTGYMM